MTTKYDNVIVAGAGPSGLLLALMLGQRGIKVDVVEALDGLDKRPRGVAYGPAAAVYVFASLSFFSVVKRKLTTTKCVTSCQGLEQNTRGRGHP
jgi:2-polyprenyl-6-methoxyphenol hydroxylase-like FAD-dependent oxidoreductase